MKTRTSGRKASTANNTLALLTAQAAAVREELVRLRQDLAAATEASDRSRASQLVDANEQLVHAALRAESIAEVAVGNLARFARLRERDPLTDTFNRATIRARLDEALVTAYADGTNVAALLVDLDDFRDINTTVGHAAGDEVMQRAAKRLGEVLRTTDDIGRQGGDEFLVVLPDAGEVREVEGIARKLLRALAEPMPVGDGLMRVSATVGIALYPADGDAAAALIQRAEAAMVHAKSLGRGRIRFHTSDADSPTGDAPQPTPREEDPEPEVPHATREQLRDLRDANEQLVLAALSAQEESVRSEQAHRRQIQFLAIVAHELRDPLAPVRAAIDVLSRRRADSVGLAALNVIIDRQAKHLTRLVDDLLDSSRGSVDKVVLDTTMLDVRVVLDNAVTRCRPVIEHRHQQLQVAWPPDPVWVHGDTVLLTQVFAKLLDNASKFTPEDGALSLTVVSGDTTVVVRVTDSGVGIGAAALPDVFEVVVHGQAAAPPGGRRLGIGLAVVRDLVEAHAGTVVATSDGKDRGSTFLVTLPLAQPPLASADAHRGLEPGAG